MLFYGVHTRGLLAGRTPVYDTSEWTTLAGPASTWDKVMGTLSHSAHWFLAPTDNLWYLRGLIECERLNRDGMEIQEQ